MTEVSTVLSASEDQAELSCTAEGCASCAGNSFCNIKARTYTALNPRGISIVPGDVVEVNLPPGKTILSGFMVLLFPLILFFVGFGAVGLVHEGAGEGMKALGGFLGLAAGFGISYLFGRAVKRKYMPVIERKMPG